MRGRAYAICNNDIVHIAWSFDAKLAGCSGFRVFRIPVDDPTHEVALRSLVAFENRDVAVPVSVESARLDDPVDTTAPPFLIRAFKWRDLLKRSERGVAVRYRIVAMQGDEATATPLPGVTPLLTKAVTPSPHCGAVDAYFNRGILSTQSLLRSLAPVGGANVSTLQKAIADTTSVVRAQLTGELQSGVLSLLERRRANGGACFAALYELTDDLLISHLEAAGSALHLVLSNNTGSGTNGYDSANQPARARVVASGAEVISRYLPDARSIGHNKFMVYVDARGVPQSVLSGSTNWTANGLCAQNNNAIVVESIGLATAYLAYWNALKADTVAAGIPVPPAGVSALQRAEYRASNVVGPKSVTLARKSGVASFWRSPNTTTVVPSRPKGAPPPPTPPDMEELFRAIDSAEQAVLVLAFQPGVARVSSSWTVIKQLSLTSKQKPHLFVRGAVSDEDEALEFEAARDGISDAEIVAPAGVMTNSEKWLKEIYKAGFAIVHDKIVVIDPFSPKCVVVTGSHNLGFRASYNNDENMLFVRGNRKLAEAYAAHVADVFEHYRWRWYNKRDAQRKAANAWVRDGSDPAKAHDKKYDAKNFFVASITNPAIVGDAWQDRYFDVTRLASLERKFWVGDGVPLPPRAAGPNGAFTSGLTAAEIAFNAAVSALKP